MGLADRLLKASAKGTQSSMLKNSKYMTEYIGIPTNVYTLNIALSGTIKGGLLPGVGVIGGPSKHFKSNLSLELVRAYMDEHEDAICIFYDSEFGTKKGYFDKSGVDEDRVIHVPVTDIEELTFDVAQKLKEIQPEDKVVILIDSVGNLASKKEVDDAEGENSAMDMTRAKKLKGFFRIVTPKLHMKFIPMICIAHTYQCGTGDMMIKTPNGDVSLKDIGVGDRVYTTNGIESVLFKTEHEDAMVWDIELENGEVLSFTEGHRFMVNGEWKYVHDLKIGDILDSIE
ncbi:MAG: hypothetical protein R3230_00585 [Nitrosopumilaceae archaeon]|nr:hypothetical protein [Nitrosopumilaceae archaeon]